MKINIQNMDIHPIEVNEEISLEFISPLIREYYPNQASVHVYVEKIKKEFRVHIDLITKGHYVCDRCLDEFDVNFSADIEQQYHQGSGELLDEDIIRIEADAIEIDVDPVISEMMLLNHPQKMLCKEDCKGICPNCGAHLNHEACRCGEKPIDPRWEELRKLLK